MFGLRVFVVGLRLFRTGFCELTVDGGYDNTGTLAELWLHGEYARLVARVC